MDPFQNYHPNFADLASKSENLAKLVKLDAEDRVEVDFKDPASSIALTEATLKCDFGVHAALRADRLCPPVPARLAYITWLQGVLEQTKATAALIARVADEREGTADIERPAKRGKKSEERFRVLDVGTGASCILPVLGSVCYDWDFLATEVDMASLKSADDIIQDSLNNRRISDGLLTSGKQLHLKDSIQLFARQITDPLLLTDAELHSQHIDRRAWSRLGNGLLYHAVVCNPPFYESVEEMVASSALKDQAPNAVCLGTEREMICPGGEVAWIERMIQESKALQDDVIWFSTLIGKSKSATAIIDKLKEEEQVCKWFLSPLDVGKTSRSIIAWTFQPYNPASTRKTSTSSSPEERVVRCDATLRSTTEKDAENGNGLSKHLLSCLDKLSIANLRIETDCFVSFLHTRTWGRQGRRARERGKKVETGRDYILGVKMIVYAEEVRIVWLYGRDPGHFHSFCSVLDVELNKP